MYILSLYHNVLILIVGFTSIVLSRDLHTFNRRHSVTSDGEFVLCFTCTTRSCLLAGVYCVAREELLLSMRKRVRFYIQCTIVFV